MKPLFWKGKSVFLTGHTGFKGGWIAHWLSELGAQVNGFALQPPTEPNFFTETHLQKHLAHSRLADIRDRQELAHAIDEVQPEIVFHMAAQPLVRDSYRKPVETFATNVMGTVNLLEVLRHTRSVKVIVNITTDKCYENKEWLWAYREHDKLGGHDPYSASKACAEIASAAYQNSFLEDAGIFMATVRAGNVIGGGDWATDRLVPDFLRAIDTGQILRIRSPNAVRPWQHVLEPLAGYLMLAEKLFQKGADYVGAWNFGPNEDGLKPVSWLVEHLCKCIPDARWDIENTNQLHEANILNLDSTKAKTLLGWEPRWNLQTAINQTVEWFHAWRKGDDMAAVTREQIKAYLAS